MQICFIATEKLTGVAGQQSTRIRIATGREGENGNAKEIIDKQLPSHRECTIDETRARECQTEGDDDDDDDDTRKDRTPRKRRSVVRSLLESVQGANVRRCGGGYLWSS